jgi:hypothetical protein
VLLCIWATADLVTRDNGTGRIYCRSARFLVPFEATDAGPSGVAAVRLHYTTDDGRTWNLFGEKPEVKGSFEFTAPADGVYGFTVEAVDKAGNVERKGGPAGGTRPEITVVVDTRPPQIEAVFPRQDIELVPGAHLRVRFRAEDLDLAPSTAAVSIRKDDMQTWAALSNVTCQDDEFFAQGDILFPGTYEVKLSVSDRAGNCAEQTYSFVCTPNAKPPVKAPGPVGQDWEVPIVAPPRAKSLVFDIDYKVEDIGGQPPAAVGLWYTTDAGNTWQFYGLDPDVTSPFRFQAPTEAIYGFKLTATTRSGISEEPPHPGTKPDISTLVDVTYPTLMLDDPRGGESYAGGDVHYIKWTARDDHFGSLPISIYIARDGGQWELLAADLPNSGTYGWNVPHVDYATYRLKVEARDQVGNTTTVLSDNFYIVSAPPETRIRAIIPASPLLGVAEVGPEASAVKEASEPPKPAPEPTAPPRGNAGAEVKDLLDRATGMRLRGDYAGAEAALRDAVKRDAGNVAARNELGALLIQQGRHSEAVEVLKEARSLDAQDTDVLYNLASAHYALGQFKEAAAAFATIVALDPANEAALWNEAKARYAAKDVAGARQAWQKIVATNAPGSAFVQRARQALAAIPEPKK